MFLKKKNFFEASVEEKKEIESEVRIPTEKVESQPIPEQPTQEIPKSIHYDINLKIQDQSLWKR